MVLLTVGAGAVLDSLACFGDPFSPIGLPLDSLNMGRCA